MIKPKYLTPADWDAAYRDGTPPWDADVPHAELARILDEHRLRPQTVLEIGCGTGADAIVLARRRFEVTAIDCSAIALERARYRAEQRSDWIHFVLADIFEFVRSAPRFDLVYDAGVYHYLRQTHLDRYLDVLWRVTRPGSYYLCLAGSPSETDENGPPQVTEDDINNELCRLFEIVQLRPTRLESPVCKEGYPAWSCLLKRPEVSVKK
jgi:SAM-dependent methyltransferase